MHHSQRTRNLSAAAVCLATLAGLSDNAHAQGETGFLRGRGKLDLVTSWNRDTYDDFFIGDSPFAPRIGGTRRDVYSLYGAYGLTDDVDLIANAAYVEAVADAESFLLSDESALQDLTLGAKVRIGSERIGAGEASLLFAPGIKLPLTDYADFRENAINAPGHGQVDLRARVIGQYHFDAGPWVALETGYDRRNGAPADEVPFNLTIGFNVLERLTLMPFYGHTFGIGETPDDSGLETSGARYDRFGLGAYWRISDTYGLSGNYRRTDEGRNESEGFSLGLVLRF
ncbi:MAG: transporter [Planctomycetes bacterium]|nr:transporter [Planctomycetota bacterium]